MLKCKPQRYRWYLLRIDENYFNIIRWGNTEAKFVQKYKVDISP